MRKWPLWMSNCRSTRTNHLTRVYIAALNELSTRHSGRAYLGSTLCRGFPSTWGFCTDSRSSHHAPARTLPRVRIRPGDNHPHLDPGRGGEREGGGGGGERVVFKAYNLPHRNTLLKVQGDGDGSNDDTSLPNQ